MLTLRRNNNNYKKLTQKNTSIVNNQQLMNIGNIINTNNTNVSIEQPSSNEEIANITILNNIMQNNISSKYKIVKYLGNGINGHLYLAIDKTTNKKFVLKQIKLQENDEENKSIQKQIELELNILQLLSNNTITRDFINPCIEYKIVNDNILTLFPIYNGFSLSFFKRFLTPAKINDVNEYYKIVFHLIKSLLFGLSRIHLMNIAHQNIDENAILISTNQSRNIIKIKYTDFGLGCGNLDTSNVINIDNYESNIKMDKVKCSKRLNLPLSMTTELISKITDKDALKIAQNYDLFALGVIILKLLVPFENIDINPAKGFNKYFKKMIKLALLPKYINSNVSANTNNRIHNTFTNKSAYTYEELSKKNKKLLSGYLKLLDKFVFCSNKDIKPAQYVLDKIVIFEKYNY